MSTRIADVITTRPIKGGIHAVSVSKVCIGSFKSISIVASVSGVMHNEV